MSDYVDYEGFQVDPDPFIEDPPYMGGDHAAQCPGCLTCVEAEETWFAERAGSNAEQAEEVTP